MVTRRKSILNRVHRIVLAVALAAMLISNLVGMVTMNIIRNRSGAALTDQLETNLLNTVADKAALADSSFGHFRGNISDFANKITDMYEHPEQYTKMEVLPPDAANAGVFAMQRYLRDESVDVERVRDEIDLFGNLEVDWNSVVTQNENVITTIYIGTESGLHVAYDKQSDLGVTEGSKESYFDYTDSNWYRYAKESGEPGFTEIYEDSYGRGLMISCYAPFYDGDQTFRGVICMDMQITDIYSQIVNMDIGDTGRVFMVDRKNQTVNEKGGNTLIPTDTVIESEDVRIALMKKETGFMLSEQNIYYAYANVDTIDGQLCIRIPRNTVMEPVDRMSRAIRRANVTYLGVLALLMAAVYLISKRFAKSLTDPLLELGKDAWKIASGDLDHRAEIRTNDEIGDLAQRFNDMSAALKRYVADLTIVTKEKERIGAELNIATQIQASMLPSIFPPFPERDEFDIYASMNPAKEVGGDFYDFFMVDDNHIALVMADVSGKGVPAALFMVIAKTLIKTRAQMGGSPAEILNDVNAQLCEGNDAGYFVTVWMGIIDITTGKGMATNAGHEHPIIRHGEGLFESVKYKHSPAVAIMDGMMFREHEFDLSPGDALYVYTDGVMEATNAQEELFGEDRALEALNRDPLCGPKGNLDAVKAAIDAFVGEAEQFDDITMLSFHYYGKKK